LHACFTRIFISSFSSSSAARNSLPELSCFLPGLCPDGTHDKNALTLTTNNRTVGEDRSVLSVYGRALTLIGTMATNGLQQVFETFSFDVSHLSTVLFLSLSARVRMLVAVRESELCVLSFSSFTHALVSWWSVMKYEQNTQEFAEMFRPH